MKKNLWLPMAALLLTCQVMAQVKTNFNNPDKIGAAGKFNAAYTTTTFELTPPDLGNALARDRAEAESGSKIIYIAEPVAVNLDLGKMASWTDQDKFSYGRFTIHAKGARSLSINFTDFFLPDGTEMYIYNKDGNMITGPVTEGENNKSGLWGSSIYQGDEVTVEVKLPTASRQELRLHITNIAYGYKDVFISKTPGFGTSGACNFNVLCPLGNGWAPERNSVAFIAKSNGQALCSGALVMNTCGTNTPYVLTANHCFTADGNVGGWRLHFQAWSATCTPNQNSDGILFNGATHRANWEASDFCLVQMNQTPAANSGIHYAGWTRATGAATSGAGIHHPSGDVMKISTYTAPLQRLDNAGWVVNGNTVFAPGTLHWRVQWPTHNGAANGNPTSGITEGGSSGSPLFDQNHRIVGQLAGGTSACVTTLAKQDNYGRFDNSWTGGGTNNTRLSNWLDPNGFNSMTANTTNISQLPAPSGWAISGPAYICSGSAQYTLTNVPAGVTVNWTSSSPSSATVPPTGNPVTVNYVSYGYTTLTATVGNCVVATKQIALGHSPITASTSINGCNGAYAQWFISMTPTSHGSNWSWSVNYLGTNSQITIASPNSPSTWVSVKGGGTIRLNYTDACGVARQDGITVYSTCPGRFMVSVSPNPVKNNMNVAISEGNDSKQSPENTGVKPLRQLKSTGKTILSLFAVNTSTLVKQWTYNDTKNPNYNLNINGLRTGVYVLQVDRDNSTEVTKIVVE